MTDLYLSLATLSNATIVYFMKLCADKPTKTNFFLLVLSIVTAIITSLKVFKSKQYSFMFVTVCLKALPVILLAVADVFLLNEYLSLYNLFGIFMIIIGILFVSIKPLHNKK